MYMENNQQFSPQESLQLIEGMIQKTQNRFNENGTLYLLWGWVIFFCATVHYILAKYTSLNHIEYIWGLTWVAVIYQIIYLVRKEKSPVVKTYTEEIISYVWIVFGISMGMVTFILGNSNLWPVMYPLILMLYGMPTFLSGAIMRFKPLMFGGFICWVLCIISKFIPAGEVLLLLALAVLSAWIIPGYLMRKKFKGQSA
jgi:hypothetical protein